MFRSAKVHLRAPTPNTTSRGKGCTAPCRSPFRLRWPLAKLGSVHIDATARPPWQLHCTRRMALAKGVAFLIAVSLFVIWRWKFERVAARGVRARRLEYRGRTQSLFSHTLRGPPACPPTLPCTPRAGGVLGCHTCSGPLGRGGSGRTDRRQRHDCAETRSFDSGRCPPACQCTNYLQTFAPSFPCVPASTLPHAQPAAGT